MLRPELQLHRHQRLGSHATSPTFTPDAGYLLSIFATPLCLFPRPLQTHALPPYQLVSNHDYDDGTRLALQAPPRRRRRRPEAASRAVGALNRPRISKSRSFDLRRGPVFAGFETTQV